MKLKQVLEDLGKLAPTVGLQKGLEDSGALAQKKKTRAFSKSEEKGE